MTVRIVCLPLDGSEQAMSALPVARRLAELQDALLHVIHVAEAEYPTDEAIARAGLAGVELHRTVVDTRAGEPASAILEAARERAPVLLVMSSRTRTGGDELLGRTAFAVLRDAPCPVVLVRPERGAVPWDLRRMLVPHDGTPSTSAALGPAEDLARRAGAEVVLLHVAAASSAPPGESGSLPSPRYADQPQHEWPEWVSEFLERLGCMSSIESLRLRLVLGHGVPGEEVLQFAEHLGSDLIVLAWRGAWNEEHGRTVKLTLGSATCPVMIVRAQNPDAGCR